MRFVFHVTTPVGRLKPSFSANQHENIINRDVAVTQLITPCHEKCYDHTLHSNFGGNKWRYDDFVTTMQSFTLKVIKRI